jgi:hypothetical protein
MCDQRAQRRYQTEPHRCCRLDLRWGVRRVLAGLALGRQDRLRHGVGVSQHTVMRPGHHDRFDAQPRG